MQAGRPFLGIASTVVGLVACEATVPLSSFELDERITGRVVENVTACVVDATCLLRIEFADTLVDAIYGTGEREAPACAIPQEAADAAFAAERGKLIEARISHCPGEGYLLQDVRGVRR